MNRRDFMRSAAAGISARHIPVRLIGEGKAATSHWAWIKSSLLVAVGGRDDMAIFFRRLGEHGTREEATHGTGRAKATVSETKDLGVRIAIIDFFKGHGLEAEPAHPSEFPSWRLHECYSRLV
jgi:hypothetical protein